MTEREILVEMLHEKLIAIFRGISTEIIGDVAKAMVKAGVKFIEVTFNQKSDDIKGSFKAQIEAVKAAVGNSIVLGAGTVLTVEQAVYAVENDCRFIVSPNTDEAVIKKAKELGCISIPGAMSPSEIVKAHDAGADVVKLYIVEEPQYVKYLQGPLGHIKYQATCNVSPETIPAFLKAGTSLFGTRAFITNEMLENKQYDRMEEEVSKYIAAIKNN